MFDECLSSRAHFCCRCTFIPDTPLGQPPTSIAPVQRICSRSSNSLCLCIESTFSLPWARMCCACAAILNSPHRLIIAAQAAANRAALLQRVRSDHKILNPKTAFTPTIMPCGPHTGNLLFHKQPLSSSLLSSASPSWPSSRHGKCQASATLITSYAASIIMTIIITITLMTIYYK